MANESAQLGPISRSSIDLSVHGGITKLYPNIREARLTYEICFGAILDDVSIIGAFAQRALENHCASWTERVGSIMMRSPAILDQPDWMSRRRPFESSFSIIWSVIHGVRVILPVLSTVKNIVSSLESSRVFPHTITPENHNSLDGMSLNAGPVIDLVQSLSHTLRAAHCNR